MEGTVQIQYSRTYSKPYSCSRYRTSTVLVLYTDTVLLELYNLQIVLSTIPVLYRRIYCILLPVTLLYVLVYSTGRAITSTSTGTGS